MSAVESRVENETERYVEELLAAAPPLSESQSELVKSVMSDARTMVKSDRKSA